MMEKQNGTHKWNTKNENKFYSNCMETNIENGLECTTGAEKITSQHTSPTRASKECTRLNL